MQHGKWHKVDVFWDASQQTLSYAFDGMQAETFTGDLANTYVAGSQFAYFGFTAATGGATNLQQVQVTSFDAMLENGMRSVLDVDFLAL